VSARRAASSHGVSIIGVVLIVIGSLHLLALLLHGSLAPVLLVGAGAFFLWQAFASRPAPVVADTNGTVSDEAVLGQVKRAFPAGPLRGGRVTSVLGSVGLDLRQATVGTEPVTLDVTAVLGQVVLQVPAGCEVDVRIAAFLGNVESRLPEPKAEESRPRLVLTGSVVMGSVEIRG
jgi:hypothetical protein